VFATQTYRLAAIARDIFHGLAAGKPEVRRLIAPLMEERIREFVPDDADPDPRVVLVSFVGADGRADAHEPRGPVSLHVHTRYNATVVRVPFLVVDLRVRAGTWFFLFLLRELESLRLARIRAAEADEGAMFYGPRADQDAAAAHRFVGTLLERVAGPFFNPRLRKVRRAAPADRRSVADTLAEDFCEEIRYVWQSWPGMDAACRAFIADALFHGADV